MTTHLSFNWDDRQARRAFNRLRGVAGGRQGLLQAIGDALVNRTQLGFHDETDPWGNPWRPLSEVTVAMRRDQGVGGVSILRDTGQLVNSITSHARAGGTQHGAAGVEIRIGFVDRPATIHQFGGRAGRGRKVTIPARPMLPIRQDGTVDLPPAWRDDIGAVVDDFMTRALGATA